MKKTIVVFLSVLLLVSVGFAEKTEIEAQDKLNDAKDAVEEAELAVSGNETDYTMYFERCPDVEKDWNDANTELTNAQDLYDDAFEDYILANYDDSYVASINSISSANEVIDLIEGLPLKVVECEREERREAASQAISQMTATKNRVKDIVTPKLSCTAVQANWTRGNEQSTLANTHYTGGDYISAKNTAELAVTYYEAAETAAIACVVEEPSVESDMECEVDSHCESDEHCSEGKCVAVECECGYIGDHKCFPYDCCSDEDCPTGYACELHECVETIQPGDTEVPPLDKDEGAFDYSCLFPSFILLALAGLVVSRG